MVDDGVTSDATAENDSGPEIQGLSGTSRSSTTGSSTPSHSQPVGVCLLLFMIGVVLVLEGMETWESVGDMAGVTTSELDRVVAAEVLDDGDGKGAGACTTGGGVLDTSEGVREWFAETSTLLPAFDDG